MSSRETQLILDAPRAALVVQIVSLLRGSDLEGAVLGGDCNWVVQLDATRLLAVKVRNRSRRRGRKSNCRC